MSSLPLFDAAWSQRAKEAGIAQTASANADFVQTMRDEATRIAKERGKVHIDDLRLRAIQLGIEPKSSAAWGSIFAERGKWRKSGYRASELPTNHGHVSPEWELVA